ncbi:MAG: hypothetical protein ACI8XC_003186 [Gammaproteobacteria bacterium]|jgi:hypothetical protein
MTDEKKIPDSATGKNIQVHVPPELDYLYRDISNVFVGAGDVVLEFGNFHRSMPGNATISNRIVLSVSSAYQLHNSLGQALADAQNKLQQSLKK